jgi:hypothetical protein
MILALGKYFFPFSCPSNFRTGLSMDKSKGGPNLTRKRQSRHEAFSADIKSLLEAHQGLEGQSLKLGLLPSLKNHEVPELDRTFIFAQSS